MDFSCQRHDILITPHERNEVERSVGAWRVQHPYSVLKTRNY